jgi:ring-1,2-phenylacetyl-CoA epoxidase subunit PaaA
MTLADAEPELLASFERTIAANDRIEPRDWMPEKYRRPWSARSPSTRTPRSSACSRRATGSPARPSLRRKAILLAKVQDEAGHGLYLYSACETLGVSRAS